MRCPRAFEVAAVLLASVAALLAAPAARAADDGHRLPPDVAAGSALDQRAGGNPPRGEDRPGEVSLQFTPRNPLLLMLGETPERPPESAELRLWFDRSPQLGSRLGMIDSGAADQEPGLGRLEIGGALRWSDWSLGSSYARTQLFGADTSLFSASLGYGRLTTRLGFGESERQQTPSVDVLMFSTDLAASSWLTLEGDLAMGAGPTRETESQAVGRLGFRLRF
jgi:hypothetical protein